MDFVLVLLVMLLRQEVAALKLLHIKVPPYTFRDKSATLECSYDLESDSLYGVTWYKDNEQFYKYEVKGSKKKRIFDVSGVAVNADMSNGEKVILEGVNFNSSGMYKCEVNAEAPSFNSVSDQAEMEVIVAPKQTPTIIGEDRVYATGDVLALNCTSDKSRPAARLEWFVNDKQIKAVSSNTLKDDTGLYLTVSSLLLELESVHLTEDKINVSSRSGQSDVALAMSADSRAAATISAARVDLTARPRRDGFNTWGRIGRKRIRTWRKRKARSDERFVTKDNHTLIRSKLRRQIEEMRAEIYQLLS